MLAPRVPRRGPLRGDSEPTACPRRASWHASGVARGRTGRQVFRIPDFQVPAHASRALPTPQVRGRVAVRLGTWKPGNLSICRVTLSSAHSKRTSRTAEIDPKQPLPRPSIPASDNTDRLAAANPGAISERHPLREKAAFSGSPSA
jgi:hypothetical protein